MSLVTYSFIEVNTTIEGFHHWPDAPDEVKFLRDSHRHIFHVQLKAQVLHDDRELEFILVKRWLDQVLWVLRRPGRDFQSHSCEQIAKWVLERFVENYGKRRASCKVMEDGENGAIVEIAK